MREATAHALALVAPMPPDAEVLAEMNAAVLAARQALQAAIDRRDAFCRQWGEDNGFLVRLDADQVRRAIQGGRR